MFIYNYLARGGATKAVGALGDALIEIGESQLNYLVYVALLQVNMFLGTGIDFIQKKGVQFHCSKGEFRVGASLTKKPMFKANTSLMQVFSVRRVRYTTVHVRLGRAPVLIRKKRLCAVVR